MPTFFGFEDKVCAKPTTPRRVSPRRVSSRLSSKVPKPAKQLTLEGVRGGHWLEGHVP